MEIGNWNTRVRVNVEIIFQNLALIVFDRKWEDAAAVAVFMVIMLSVSLHQWCVIMLYIFYKSSISIDWLIEGLYIYIYLWNSSFNYQGSTRNWSQTHHTDCRRKWFIQCLITEKCAHFVQIYILFIIYKYNLNIPEIKSMNDIVHKWVKGLTATGI